MAHSLKDEVVQLQEQIDIMKLKLQQEKERKLSLEKSNAELQEEIECVKMELTSVKQEVHRREEQTQQDSENLMKENTSLKQQRHTLQARNGELQQKIKNDQQKHEEENSSLQERLRKLESENQHLKDKQHADAKIRRKLHNKIIELKGNIRVFCRVRPFLAKENPEEVFHFLSNDKLEVDLDAGVKTFEFNKIFRPTDTQEDVFTEVQEVIQSAMDGYNVCLFAYGQTSSGKTFTMEGGNLENETRGLIPRSVDKIFTSIANFNLQGWEYEIKISALQIYNGEVRDLLNTSDENLKVLMWKSSEVKVVNLKQVNVNNPQDVYILLKEAKKNRATGATDANTQSSRSHSVFTLYLAGRNSKTQERMTSRLDLVDLAGSERHKHSKTQGDRFRETTNINKSLTYLKSVLKELGSKKKHVGYRNSKLTSVLRPSLGGESKVLMILNVCPGKALVKESLLSLQFGSETSRVELGKVRRNVSKTR